MPTVDFDEPLGLSHTVDGSEIWRSPVELGSLSHYLQGFYIPGDAEFLPSTAAAFGPFGCLWLLDFVFMVASSTWFFSTLKGGNEISTKIGSIELKSWGGFPKFREIDMNLKWNN